jgi:probable rRNA maturation factor
MGFEPMTPISRSNRLAGGRTRPLCDPSSEHLGQYSTVFLLLSTGFRSSALSRHGVFGIMLLWAMTKPEINISVKRNLVVTLSKSWLEKVALTVLEVEGISHSTEMGLLITDNKTVQRLNRVYRGEDEPTDVLSFQMTPDATGDCDASFISAPDNIKHLGEVVIAYPQVEKQAIERGYAIEQELALLIIHGTLHLLGYDHESCDDAQIMRAKENQIMRLVEAV